MNAAAKTSIILLLATLSLAACSGTPPEPERDPYNAADSQRTRAGQTQDELSSDTSNNK